MIYFSAQDWIIPGIFLILIFAVLFIILFRKSTDIKKHLKKSSIIKFTAVLSIIFCLLDPQILKKEPVKGETSFIMLSDNSQSMKLKPKNASLSNADRLTKLLNDGLPTWQKRLQNDFDFHHFKFGQNLREITESEVLKYEDKATDVVKHLGEIGDRFEKGKTGGILLLTDGILTDKDKQLNFDKLPPVYPVILQNDSLTKDLSISDISASVSAFEDAPVDITIELNQRGFDDKNVTLELLNEKGAVLETRTWKVNGKSEIFRLQPRDDESGIRFYKARVYSSEDKSDFLQGKPIDELTVKNNEKTLRVDRRGGPYKILYVSGRPNWEYKFLSRALAKENKIQLRALIRLAKREEKFNFRPGRNSNVNPLFQALDEDKANQGESFDEPVFMRINTEDDKELESGFPNTKEELFKYHSLIIDDCEAAFFTTDQLSLINDFVNIRGGSLLMLAGMESLREGNYDQTPLKDILPVYLNRPIEKGFMDKSYRLKLSREGWLAPWVRLSDNEPDEQKRLSTMPEFQVLNQVSGIKPGARLVANVTDRDDKQFPALIFQKSGLGRACVFTIGDFWRWGMQNQKSREDMNKAWRQMLRWLTAEVPKMMELKVDSNSLINKPVLFEFTPRNNAYEKIAGLSPILKITDVTGETSMKKMAPDEKEKGLYKAKYYPEKKGVHKVKIQLPDQNLPEQGKSNNAFNFEAFSPEDQSLETDKAYLQNLAQKTGGKIIDADDIADFAKSIPQENFKVTKEESVPLWNSAWILSLILLLLSGDWWLRRTKGIP